MSAIVVAESGYRTMALLGTKASFSTLSQLCDEQVVIAWMDPDTAGRTGYRELRRHMQLSDTLLLKVQSEADPKYSSKSSVRHLIQTALREASSNGA